ncbi:predicted protein [Culex quinquefasciatus]|uniref:Predicted protein n=1 Tax=Culex quinquefasciatus TaxID=7176 RepID=B0WTQ9_CULQU|nr:predicted protein [Culex quinquefasciatus]|eukprot:XP_001855273.1 predicted protein [Culex quinquefasciatus]
MDAADRGTTTPRGRLLVPEPPLAEPPASALRCSYCGKTLATMSSFRKHVKTQHQQPPSLEVCSICAATFPDKKKLRDHVTQDHPTVNKCRYCGFVYRYCGNLARHEASCILRANLWQVSLYNFTSNRGAPSWHVCA